MVMVVLVVGSTAVQLEDRVMVPIASARLHRAEVLWDVSGHQRYQPKPEWQNELM